MSIKEFLLSKKGVAFVWTPMAATVGITATYFLLSRARKVTITADKAQAQFCTEPYTLTVTVTDGLGRPVPREEVTLRFYINGNYRDDLDLKRITGPDGKISVSLCWECPQCPPQHIDEEQRVIITNEAVCKGASDSVDVVEVLPVCLNLPCSCAG